MIYGQKYATVHLVAPKCTRSEIGSSFVAIQNPRDCFELFFHSSVAM